MTGKNERSPLARLVVFMVCLAILGSIIATAHYYAVDLPEQNNIMAPENSQTNSLSHKCTACLNYCNYLPDLDKYPCLIRCELIC